MLQRYVVTAAAWLEMVAGAAFLVVPDVVSQLLFGAQAEGTGMPFARFAGVGLFALGISCRRSTGAESRPGAVVGLFVFNAAAAALLAWLGLATMFHGVALWPAAILHAVIAVALLRQLQTGATGT